MGASSFFSGLSRRDKSSSNNNGTPSVGSSFDATPTRPTDGLQNISGTVPAWHVHTSRPSSAGLTENNAAVQHVTSDAQAPSSFTVASSIPSRSSSLRSNPTDHASRRRKSLPRPELDRIDSESIPGLRPEDMTIPTSITADYEKPRRRSNCADDEYLARQIASLSTQSDRDEAIDNFRDDNFDARIPESARSRNVSHRARNPAGLSHMTPSTNKPTASQMQHLRLPAGFELRDSSHTVVDTHVRPAVTHETIHRNITEIQQEVVTRDIHFHHYYNYIQPIKVVEILPAKHYVLNVKGEKVEIPAPAGWQMPSSLSPHTPDLSHIKGSVRHYLVNEQHPTGIDEPAPSDYSYDVSPRIIQNKIP